MIAIPFEPGSRSGRTRPPSAVTLATSWCGAIWPRSSGSIGASPMSLVVTSIARTSSVCSSIPRWILRQTRRLAPPCLRAFHSPSPSTLIPVLSISRCSGLLISTQN